MTILYVYIVQTLDHLTYSVVLLIPAAIKMSFVWCRTQTVGFNQIFDLNDLLQTSSRIYIIKRKLCGKSVLFQLLIAECYIIFILLKVNDLFIKGVRQIARFFL